MKGSVVRLGVKSALLRNQNFPLLICFMTCSSPRRPLFYTCSQLSALQSCALIFSTNFSLFSHLNNELHNFVIELCSALKIILFLTVFSKFAHSFVAIELLTFSKMQNSIFIAQESSEYLGFKKIRT